jgi:hypothetical protein
MFTGLFNDPGRENCGGGCGLGGCFGNCTWLLLILLFLCCCGGKIGNFNVTINPTCLGLMIALLCCCGGLKFGRDCK